MFKKLIPFICLTLLAAMVFYICFIPNNIINPHPSPTVATTEDIQDAFEQGISGTKTLENVKLAVLSYKVLDIEKMNFSNSTPQCNKGTAITLLLYSNNISIPLSQIESVQLKTTGGSLIENETNLFTLNNKKACLALIKIQDNKKLENLSLTIKTYDGNSKDLSLPTKETPHLINPFTTELSQAKNGDIINIGGVSYFILENSIFETYKYQHSTVDCSETITGVILVPLNNTFTPTLTYKNFTVVHHDSDKEVDTSDISVHFLLNSEQMIEKYSNKFENLYCELLTCSFKVSLENSTTEEEALKHKEDVVNNSWYKIATEDNALFKIVSTRK